MSTASDAQERLGRAVTVCRAERRMQRKALAERTGLSYPFLCEIESGKRGMSHRSVVAITEAFGIMPSDLHRMADALPALIETRTPCCDPHAARAYSGNGHDAECAEYDGAP